MASLVLQVEDVEHMFHCITLVQEMKTQFVRFEAAEQYLPNNVSANGLSFTKGSDGYFYSKPSSKVWHRSSTGFMEPQVSMALHIHGATDDASSTQHKSRPERFYQHSVSLGVIVAFVCCVWVAAIF